MPRLLIVALVVIGCGNNSGETCMRNGHTYAVGETYPAGDNCNSCTCSASGEACTKRACQDGGIDAPACAASGGCPNGPACGATCCGTGEKCVAGACQCGTAAPCTDGNTCEAAGPLGTDNCGGICCGTTGACPQ